MYTANFRSLSATELAKDLARPFRFEVWRDEPNVKDRPYRRKTDRRTHAAWHNLKNSQDWLEIFPLIKRGQRLRIRTYLRRSHSGGASIRYVSVRIENRKPKP